MYERSFVCFKHKRAYELRISDWSSDVCSSDLRSTCRPSAACGRARSRSARSQCARDVDARRPPADPARQQVDPLRGGHEARDGPRPRSEEHTSELQSLMRNSYADFCLTNTYNTVYTYDTL